MLDCQISQTHRISVCVFFLSFHPPMGNKKAHSCGRNPEHLVAYIAYSVPMHIHIHIYVEREKRNDKVGERLESQKGLKLGLTSISKQYKNNLCHFKCQLLQVFSPMLSNNVSLLLNSA